MVFILAFTFTAEVRALPRSDLFRPCTRKIMESIQSQLACDDELEHYVSLQTLTIVRF